MKPNLKQIKSIAMVLIVIALAIAMTEKRIPGSIESGNMQSGSTESGNMQQERETSGNQTKASEQIRITPEEIGLVVERGKLNKNLMTKPQQDTIQIGQITPEDYLEDIAVLYRSKNEIITYRNEGNGTASPLSIIKSGAKKYSRIELMHVTSEEMSLNPGKRSKIYVEYTDGSHEIKENIELLTGKKLEELRAGSNIPDIMEMPRGAMFDITYIEQWRTWRNGNISYFTVVGDIDRDGKEEAIYTFYPLGGAYYPTRIVSFESLGGNQYRIDWDSTFATGVCWNYGFPITDFDNDGNLEFMGIGRDPMFQQKSFGFYECYGEGNVRYIMGSFAYFSVPFSVDIKDTVYFNGRKAKGMWVCFSNPSEPHNTTFQKYIYKQKYTGTYPQYLFEEVIENGVNGGNWFTYSISVSDYDRDGREEILDGNTQWGTNFIDYWDSTGVGTHKGYELKSITPNAPVSGGYLVGKDFDNDGKKEIIACGIGYGTGSMGVIKHSGSPGQNQWTTVWWDSNDVYAMPINQIDTGRVDGRYSVLFPAAQGLGGPYYPRTMLRLYVFTYHSGYNFFQSTNMRKDSSAFAGAKLGDMDKDGKVEIIAPSGFGVDGDYFDCLTNNEQIGTIGINPIGTEVPKGYKLNQNYPNPFNSQTLITFEIPKQGNVTLRVYDILGREIAVIVNQFLQTGNYKVIFESGKYNMTSGIYFYKMTAGDFYETKKLVFAK